jgi:hypothetical protein
MIVREQERDTLLAHGDEQAFTGLSWMRQVGKQL